MAGGRAGQPNVLLLHAAEEEEEEEAWHVGAADEGCSGQAKNAELSIHLLPTPRRGSGVRAQHQPGTLTLPCWEGRMERDKELLCASSPWLGEQGVWQVQQCPAAPPGWGRPGGLRAQGPSSPQQWWPHQPGSRAGVSGAGGARGRAGPRTPPAWPLAPLPQSPLTPDTSGSHHRSRQMPPVPPSLLPAPSSLAPSHHASGSGLHRSALGSAPCSQLG